MKRKLVILLSAIMILNFIPFESIYAVTAETQREIEKAEDEKDQLETDVKKLQEERNALNKEKNETQLELEEMQDQIAAIDLAINDINTKKAEKKSEIAATEEEIAECEEDIDISYDSMKVRIKYMYEYSQKSLWEVLLQDGIAEFLNRVDYIIAINTYDRNKLTEYKELLTELEEKKAGLEEAKAELERLESDTLVKQQELEDTKNKTNEKLNEYLASIDLTTIDLEDKSLSLQEKEKVVLALYEKAEEENKAEEERRAEEELRKLQEALEKARKEEEERKRKEEEERKRKEQEGNGEQQPGEEGEPVDGTPETDPGTETSPGEGETEPKTPGIVVEDPGISHRRIELNEDEMREFIAIIYCESRGESVEGQKAVAHVIINRILSNKFPNSLDGVVRQAWQFEPVSTGVLDYVLTAKIQGLSGIIDERAWSTCEQSAIAALSEDSNVGDSLFFRTWKPVPQLIDNLELAGVPYWVIGNHVFYYSWTVY